MAIPAALAMVPKGIALLGKVGAVVDTVNSVNGAINDTKDTIDRFTNNQQAEDKSPNGSFSPQGHRINPPQAYF